MTLEISNIAGDGGYVASPCDSQDTQRRMAGGATKAGKDYRDEGNSRCRTDHSSKSRDRNTQESGACRDENRRVEQWQFW